ncbi:MAG: hypothetical protein OEU56_24130, partial [Rhodospirillales bacterium]|nr:hypothetical protein [Rhodospirillales bacterium]
KDGNGEALEVPVVDLNFKEAKDGADTVGGSASAVDGIISTRRGSASAWTAMQGKGPVGEWEMALPDTQVVRDLFAKEQVEDILFVLTYKGRTPEWPN